MAKVVVVPSRTSMILRLVFASLGISAGLMVGMYFIHYKNIHVIFWGFFSALWASAALAMHILYWKGRLTLYVNKLKIVVWTGIVGQVLGAAAFVVYIVLGIVFHDNLKVLSDSYFVASVWGFMTWKWAFALFWFARGYRLVFLEEALIPVDDETTIYVDSDQKTTISNTTHVAAT